LDSNTSRATYKVVEDGQSYVDDAPETPAPVFAVRAFKTALFGTPHTEREIRLPALASEKDANKVPSSISNKVKKEDRIVAKAVPGQFPSATPNYESMASPTKGILVTPGTAATRRKTVSFGFNEALAQGTTTTAAVEDAEPNIDPVLTPYKEESEGPTADQPRHSKLTKQLIELSKKKPDERIPLKDLDSQPTANKGAPRHKSNTNALMVGPDTTIDLNQPESRSGQFWKTEYEEFHRKSTQEMINVLQYSQNIKTYAAIKDQEVITVNEKMEKELARLASMERKVSKLVKQLKLTQTKGPEGDSDVANLIRDLAQQTARAIMYKQKADRYKATLKQQAAKGALIEIPDGQDDNQADTSDNEELQGQTGAPELKGLSMDSVGLHAQLENLRESAKSSEHAAVRLEIENSALKRSLARVKEEMMSYEARRQAREEHLKKRESKQKAAREEAEVRLAALTVEHEGLLRSTGGQPRVKSGMAPDPIEINGMVNAINERPTRDSAEARRVDEQPQPTMQPKSPRKRRPRKDAVDIWTFNSPKDVAASASPPKESSILLPSSVKQDIKRTLKDIEHNLVARNPAGKTPQDAAEHTSPPKENSIFLPSRVKQDIKRTLREISDNLVPDQPSRTTFETKSPLQKLQASTITAAQTTAQPRIPSTARRTHTRKLISNSPRPSMINLASSPARFQPSQRQSAEHQDSRLSRATVGRSASLMSRVGNGSSMGSVRGSALPADRAAAARARLAKRSAEKKRQRGMDA